MTKPGGCQGFGVSHRRMEVQIFLVPIIPGNSYYCVMCYDVVPCGVVWCGVV